jgi:translation initiation factor 1
MPEVCKRCGLPTELCGCLDIDKEGQTSIKVFIEKRKWGREVTIVDGIDSRTIDLNSLAKKLKNQLACGGTSKDGRIELQGNHMYQIRDLLTAEGFLSDSIQLSTFQRTSQRQKRRRR